MNILGFSQDKVNPVVLREISQKENEKYTKAQEEIRSDRRLVIDPDDRSSYQGRIDGIPIYLITNDSRQAKATGVDKLYSAGTAPGGTALTGLGMVSYIWDGGRVRDTHQDLTGRITNLEASSVALSDHSSGVAGVIMATGLATGTIGGDPTSVNSRGMAYQSTLKSYDFNNNLAEIAAESANSQNSQYMISNHSYGSITGWYEGDLGMGAGWYWIGFPSLSTQESALFGCYATTDQTFDNIAYNSPQHAIIKSAGNNRGVGPNGAVAHYAYDNNWNWVQFTVSRPKDCGVTGYDCISFGSVAKNIILVGSVNPIAGDDYTGVSSVVASSFSSFGPTDDGRIKPDITAVGGAYVLSMSSTSDFGYMGWSGTSFSAPSVSGIALLLQQLYKQKYSGQYLRSDMLKVILLHTANEAGNIGPDYSYGWGLANALEAANVIVGNGTTSILENNVLNQGGNYEIEVKATGGTPLKATIVWLDPAPAGPLFISLNDRTPMLVNDLDLRITNGGNEYFPWKLDPDNPSMPATKGDNVVDNVEQVVIDAPTANQTYKVKISHKGETLTNNSQNYVLVITGGVKSTMSTEEVNIEKQIAVYPNPVVDKVNIKLEKELRNARVKILNMTGQIILDEEFKSLSSEKSFDISGYPSGVYLLYVQSDEGSFIKKLIKK